MELYPLKFKAILKEKIWGGDVLVEKLNKESNSTKIGESWELSGVAGSISEVSNGKYKGASLNELLETYKGQFVGNSVYKVFKDEFPLLFKFIDARQNLSIQLHPNNELAAKRHNSFGKTEMWYVLEADERAKLYAGLTKQLTKEEYLEAFNEGELLNLIHVDEVQKGDAFFIEVGTIHAIGEGIVLAEIQQTSDVTYRIYDWDRLDTNGVCRELHTDLALDAIDFEKVGSCKLVFEEEVGAVNQVFSCQYFTTNKLKITEELERDLMNIDSFVVYMCVEGEGQMKIENNTENIKKGETLLIPAEAENILIRGINGLELLEVYIE
ncbi:type I phosphomannose isomerase catalytic subunit [Tenacibaculum sp. MEBiC06402]|uniref:type I phosphomannose isomerase catalytic subunit n=1 Tax=unclassified Tenacibaculum TaxID=2635139 RepID=UPI003B9C1E3F